MLRHHHTATFTIVSPNPLVINKPDNFTAASCQFTDQDAVNTAFDNWLTGFSVTGGFNPEGVIAGTPVAPVLCEGGTTTVTYNVTDECGSGSETATFTINAPTAVAVTEVNDLTTSSCAYADQAAADAAFALWLDGFGVTGGCSPAFTNGTPVAPAYCGGSTLVTWTVTDHCYVTSTHTATFTINTPAAVMVTEVSDLTTPASDYADQAAINAAFTNWLNGFTVSGGCAPQEDHGTVSAPGICGGTTMVTWAVTDHCYNTTIHTANFTIVSPNPLVINKPDNFTAASCQFTDQDAVNTAFDNWLTGFNVSGGFDPQGTIAGTPVAPVLCEGGTTTVTYNVTDECGSGFETATFTINAPTAVAVTEVNDLTTSSCVYADQAAADAAFALWLDGFGVTGGCSPAFTNGTPVAPAYCGGSTLVTWTVTDHCYVTSTHTATFTINTPAAVMVTEVSDLTTPAGDYADQAAINAAFTNWLNGFAVSGGCAPQEDHGTVSAPGLCGGTTTVTWTVTDHCYATSTHTASFTIVSPNPLVINKPDNFTAASCQFTDQDAVNTAFDNWLTGFSVTGGFNPQGTISGIPVAPVLCEGGTTTVTYNVTDECGSGSATATFTISAPTAVAVTEVNDLTTSSCTYADQAAADAAFALWLDGFGVTGGCSPAFTNGTPAAPVYCGGNTLVTWTVTDHCYLTSTHTATFTINTPAAVMVTEVSDLTTLPVTMPIRQPSIQLYKLAEWFCRQRRMCTKGRSRDSISPGLWRKHHGHLGGHRSLLLHIDPYGHLYHCIAQSAGHQ
ncbi:MAG: hypothetical protein IPN08_18090 [Bacteroidales bacterium]|nr:hypothetical protein [Bacteroidales bacterium]